MLDPRFKEEMKQEIKKLMLEVLTEFHKKEVLYSPEPTPTPKQTKAKAAVKELKAVVTEEANLDDSLIDLPMIPVPSKGLKVEATETLPVVDELSEVSGSFPAEPEITDDQLLLAVKDSAAKKGRDEVLKLFAKFKIKASKELTQDQRAQFLRELK